MSETIFSGTVFCWRGNESPVFVVDGQRYSLASFRDPAAKGPHRATIRKLDRKIREPTEWWEISKPLVTGPRSKFASLANPWELELPNADTRAEAERLVAALFAQNLLTRPMGLQVHSC